MYNQLDDNMQYVKHVLEEFGLSNMEWYRTYEVNGMSVSVLFDIPQRDYRGLNPHNIVKAFAKALRNSPAMTKLKDSHEKELKKLKDRIAELEGDLNNTLEHLSTGYEFIDKEGNND